LHQAHLATKIIQRSGVFFFFFQSCDIEKLVDLFSKKLAKLVERKKKRHLAKEKKTPQFGQKNQCNKTKNEETYLAKEKSSIL
jgi:hypothetical protein